MTKDKDQLETDFENAVEKLKAVHEEMSPKLQEHLKKAREELNNAVNLSEKYGLPFSASVSPIHNIYSPRSFKNSEFRDLDIDVVNDICDAYGDHDYGGWEHSAVC